MATCRNRPMTTGRKPRFPRPPPCGACRACRPCWPDPARPSLSVSLTQCEQQERETMIRRHFLKAAVAVAALAGVAGTAHAADPKEINFGIISPESSSNLKNMFEPSLADIAQQNRKREG